MCVCVCVAWVVVCVCVCVHMCVVMVSGYGEWLWCVLGWVLSCSTLRVIKHPQIKYHIHSNRYTKGPHTQQCIALYRIA